MGISGGVQLDIAIGPVQGFVAQSRRTRDLWGSSYLLSYLSARAALGVERAGGKVVRPKLAGDPLYQWIERQEQVGAAAGSPPPIGSVPNHFVAVCKSVDEGRNAAQAAIAELERAWRQICEAVWDTFVADASHLGVDVEAIWHRQTAQYWEVTWTISEEKQEQSSYARRKLWRTHVLPDEPGDKCMVIPDLQELSGYVRAKGADEARAQDRFWEAIRKQAGVLNLPPGDRLSAVALVKRLFADVSEKAIGGRLNVSNWPSTVYVAAVPWIQRVLEHVPHQAREYSEIVTNVAPKGAFATAAPIVVAPSGIDTGGFERLDGNFFHRDWVINKRQCILTTSDAESDAKVRKELCERLQGIARVKGDDDKPIGYPSLFYTLLLADGDLLRDLLAAYGGTHVSEALQRFSQEVPRIVERHLGKVVYAGGDDVLAMLPVATALDCARDLAKVYRASFDSAVDSAGQDASAEPTLSMALLFTHARVPLKTALDEARHLLDDVAKDGNGRDSLAVGIMKRGGLHAQWVLTWRRRRFAEERCIDATEALQTLSSYFNRNGGARLASSLVYRVRQTLAFLCGWPEWSPGSWGRPLKDLDIVGFLKAEVINSLSHILSVDNAEIDRWSDELLQAMLDVMTPSLRQRKATSMPSDSGGEVLSGEELHGKRDPDFGTPSTEMSEMLIGVDGLLVARFLASQGDEEAEA